MFNYNTIESLIQKKFVPNLEDNIFLRYSPTLAWAYKNAKTFEGHKMVVPVEYNDAGNTQMVKPYGVVSVQPKEISTAAEYEPKLAEANLVIDVQEEIKTKTSLAIMNLITAKVRNVEKSIAASFTRSLFVKPNASTGALADPSYFNSLPYLINDKAEAVGGIDPADFPGWKSSILKDTDFTGSFDLADLKDDTTDTYIELLLAALFAKLKFRNKSSDILITCPQEVWDVYEFVLGKKKLGSNLNEKNGVAGFDTLGFRKASVVAEDAMILEQGGDTGDIFALNGEFIYWAFSPGARMASEPFIRAQNTLTKVKHFFTMGNMVTSNRAALARISGVESNVGYVNAGSAKAIQPTS